MGDSEEQDDGSGQCNEQDAWLQGLGVSTQSLNQDDGGGGMTGVTSDGAPYSTAGSVQEVPEQSSPSPLESRDDAPTSYPGDTDLPADSQHPWRSPDYPGGPMTDEEYEASQGGGGLSPETIETAKDLAKSKGMVVGGELVGGKVGGIIGYAADLATSPGGDTSLPHAIYQAVIRVDDQATVPVQGADWHLKRENAEKDAQAYTAQTGEATEIDVQYTKDDSGVVE
jgi:hypothetical protein